MWSNTSNFMGHPRFERRDIAQKEHKKKYSLHKKMQAGVPRNEQNFSILSCCC